MGSVRRVLCTQWVTDFLHYILDHHLDSTLLIICTTRDTFLEQVFAAVHAQSVEAPGRHPLLTKTIGLLSKSTKVRTVFCPTLEHLRAYLSGGISEISSGNGEQRNPSALMAILNPLSLHLSTLEFSAQGLSRTLAIAVEASFAQNMELVLCECRDPTDPPNCERGEELWYVDVPLLSNSIGMGAARSVPVKRVTQRWFEFIEINTVDKLQTKDEQELDICD